SKELRHAPTRWQAYRRLLRHALADRRGGGPIVALTPLSSVVGVLQPWPGKGLADQVPRPEEAARPLARGPGLLPGAGAPRGLLVWVVLAGLAVFGLSSTLEVVLTRAWLRVGQQSVYQLAGDLFANIQRRSLLFHSRCPVGESMNRITGDSWCVYKLVEA